MDIVFYLAATVWGQKSMMQWYEFTTIGNAAPAPLNASVVRFLGASLKGSVRDSAVAGAQGTIGRRWGRESGSVAGAVTWRGCVCVSVHAGNHVFGLGVWRRVLYGAARDVCGHSLNVGNHYHWRCYWCSCCCCCYWCWMSVLLRNESCLALFWDCYSECWLRLFVVIAVVDVLFVYMCVNEFCCCYWCSVDVCGWFVCSFPSLFMCVCICVSFKLWW